MKKAIIFCFTVLLYSSITYAQDRIYKTDNSVVEAKVIEITTAEIKYKLFSNLDGPTYVLNKSEAAIIIYQNGQHEVFSKNAKASISTIKSFHYDSLKKNIISINLFDVIYTHLTISYEYLLKSGRIGIKIPLSISHSKASYSNYSRYNFNQKTIYSAGVDLNFYPNGQKRKINYYLGPAFHYGVFNYYSSIYITPQILNGDCFALLFNNGIRFRPAPGINISFELGLGYREDRTTNYKNYIIYPCTSEEFNIGFIF